MALLYSRFLNEYIFEAGSIQVFEEIKKQIDRVSL